jgi:hypothetical protein
MACKTFFLISKKNASCGYQRRTEMALSLHQLIKEVMMKPTEPTGGNYVQPVVDRYHGKTITTFEVYVGGKRIDTFKDNAEATEALRQAVVPFLAEVRNSQKPPLDNGSPLC